MRPQGAEALTSRGRGETAEGGVLEMGDQGQGRRETRWDLWKKGSDLWKNEGPVMSPKLRDNHWGVGANGMDIHRVRGGWGRTQALNFFFFFPKLIHCSLNIYPFKLYSAVVSHRLTKLCDHEHIIPGHFLSPPNNPYPRQEVTSDLWESTFSRGART